MTHDICLLFQGMAVKHQWTSPVNGASLCGKNSYKWCTLHCHLWWHRSVDDAMETPTLSIWCCVQGSFQVNYIGYKIPWARCETCQHYTAYRNEMSWNWDAYPYIIIPLSQMQACVHTRYENTVYSKMVKAHNIDASPFWSVLSYKLRSTLSRSLQHRQWMAADVCASKLQITFSVDMNCLDVSAIDREA
jgi:hypothetical protein